MSVTRRAVLAGAAGLAATACLPEDRASPTVTTTTPPPPVYPPFQEGVLTPPPASSEFLAFDVAVADRAALADLLGRVAEFRGPDVTVTVSFGASLFDDRYGLRSVSPKGLVPMPAFPSDVSDDAWSHGDLAIQVCAETPARTARVGDDLAALPGLRPRWRLAGFRPDNGAGADGKPNSTNLFGFKEGAGNPDPRDTGLMDRLLRVRPGAGQPEWVVGGTFLVVRLIRFAMPLWDADPVPRQEVVFGRRKDTNAPLGRASEQDEPDYASDPGGQVIALDSHIRRANPRTPESMENRIHRRGYSYRRAPDAVGHEDAGLLFACYQRDIELGFATIQRRLEGEALQKYVLPFGGGYFFTPAQGASFTS